MRVGSSVLVTPLSGTKVLLIEDDDQLYRALREALQEAGADVLGAIALMPKGYGLLPLAHIDVAVIDAPRVSDAVPVLLELRERSIPCVLIAAEDHRFNGARACELLLKPFTADQLVDSVQSAVRERGAPALLTSPRGTTAAIALAERQ